jgi:hypothetical protein
MSDHVFDTAKWQNSSILFQMGNIGSEVGRTAKAYQANDTVSFEAALRRGLDLFDATIDGLAKNKSCRLKEVLLAREQFTQQFFSDSPKLDPKLEQYFMQFAIAERLQR